MRKRTSPLITALVAVVFISVVSSASASSFAPARSFAFRGANCLEGSALVPVLADALRDYVPPPFAVMHPEVGIAVLAVTALRCETMSVNGSPVASNAIFSDVGVLIDSPDESPNDVGAHIYQLWHLTNVKQVATKMSKFGVRSALVPDSSFETIHEPLTATWIGVAGDVPWIESPYNLTVRGSTPDPAAPKATGANTWWHQTPDHIVKITRSGMFAGAPGTFELTTTPGTPLGDIVGSPKMAGAAQTLHLDTEGGVVSVATL